MEIVSFAFLSNVLFDQSYVMHIKFIDFHLTLLAEVPIGMSCGISEFIIYCALTHIKSARNSIEFNLDEIEVSGRNHWCNYIRARVIGCK